MRSHIIFYCIIFFIALTVSYSCSQENDPEISKGFYKGKEVEYYKGKLKVYLIDDSIKSEAYMKKVNELIASKSGFIDSIYSFSNSKMAAVKFQDENYDVLRHINDFEESKLFKYVALYYVLRPDDLDY